MHQLSFASLDFAAKKKRTKRDVFQLEALIEPYYPKTGPKDGRPPFPLSTMLRRSPDPSMRGSRLAVSPC